MLQVLEVTAGILLGLTTPRAGSALRPLRGTGAGGEGFCLLDFCPPSWAPLPVIAMQGPSVAMFRHLTATAMVLQEPPCPERLKCSWFTLTLVDDKGKKQPCESEGGEHLRGQTLLGPQL